MKKNPETGWAFATDEEQNLGKNWEQGLSMSPDAKVKQLENSFFATPDQITTQEADEAAALLEMGFQWVRGELQAVVNNQEEVA